ncbi:MAG TPA: TonB family protein [Pyrinomonadaceae bacterium]|jgi:TonB family protein
MNKIFISVIFALCFCALVRAQETQTNSASSSKDVKTNPQASTDGAAKGIRLLSRPGALYTDIAKRNDAEGKVTLKVAFLASGEIGEISVVSGLPYGLTEQAIKAARQIKFEPAKKNNQPYSVFKTVVYSFSVPRLEDEKEIKKRAVIIEQPKAEFPAEQNYKNMSGTVTVTVILTSFDEIQIQFIKSDLPQAFKDKAMKAASKIKYEPALLKNDVKASVIREIVYEFKPEN